jgi:hypothetical protein
MGFRSPATNSVNVTIRSDKQGTIIQIQSADPAAQTFIEKYDRPPGRVGVFFCGKPAKTPGVSRNPGKQPVDSVDPRPTADGRSGIRFDYLLLASA